MHTSLYSIIFTLPFLPLFEHLIPSAPCRLTDMKWPSVTTKQQQILQITKWRASSHKLTSFPEHFGETGGRQLLWGLPTQVKKSKMCSTLRSRWLSPSSWSSLTWAEHWCLKTKEFQISLEVPSCRSVCLFGNKVWRLKEFWAKS